MAHENRPEHSGRFFTSRNPLPLAEVVHGKEPYLSFSSRLFWFSRLQVTLIPSPTCFEHFI